MPLLMLKDVPRYSCLCEAAEKYPSLEPAAAAAFLNLLRTGDEVFAAESRFLAANHISQGRFTVLMLLNCCPEEPSTPAELAEEAGVTRATMTGLLDTLERDHLIQRETDTVDRRAVRVSLTATGQKLLDSMLPSYFSTVTAIMRGLTTEEQRQLVVLLQKIQGVLSEESPAPASAATAS